MVQVIPPWPPDDFQDPLPFDQRGACWPFGPCGPPGKLEIRYDVIGRVSAGGWINDGWGELKTGALYVIINDNVNQRTAPIYLSGIHAPPLPQNAIQFIREPDNQWRVEFQYWTELIGPIPAWCFAEGYMTESSCGSSTLILPVTSAPPLTDPPEFIEIKGVLWYQMAAYPWPPFF